MEMEFHFGVYVYKPVYIAYILYVYSLYTLQKNHFCFYHEFT